MLELFAKVIGALRRAFGAKQPLTPQDYRYRRELSQAIIESARAYQQHYKPSSGKVIAYIPDLANVFRETSQVVKDALLLLSEDGRARKRDRYAWVIEADDRPNEETSSPKSSPVAVGEPIGEHSTNAVTQLMSGTKRPCFGTFGPLTDCQSAKTFAYVATTTSASALSRPDTNGLKSHLS
jgi:hypothetical protein